MSHADCSFGEKAGKGRRGCGYAIVQGMVRRGPLKRRLMSRPIESKAVSLLIFFAIWGDAVPGRGTCKCKGPEAAARLVRSRPKSQKAETSELGQEEGRQSAEQGGPSRPSGRLRLGLRVSQGALSREVTRLDFSFCWQQRWFIHRSRRKASVLWAQVQGLPGGRRAPVEGLAHGFGSSVK